MGETFQAPTNLYAVTGGSTEIDLSWDVNEPTAHTEIQKKAAGGIYSTHCYIEAGDNSTTITGLSPDTLYYFRARHVLFEDYSAWSNEAEDYTGPAAPSGLAVSWVGKTATLTWTNNATYSAIAVYYKLSSSGTWTTDTESLSGSATTRNIVVASEDTDYDFAIRAKGGTSAYWSDYDTLSNQTSELMPPTNMGLTCPSTTSVTISWEDNSVVEDGYEIYMDGALIYTTAADATEYTKTGLTEDETYTFKVGAKKGSVYSDFTPEQEIVVGTPPDANPIIGAVTVNGQDSITVIWTCSATNEDGFQIYRSTDGTAYSYRDAVGEDQTSFTDTGLSPYTTYYYKVRAYNSHGYSSFTTALYGTTDPDLDAPTALRAMAVSSTSIRLDFTVNAASASNHKIERKTSGGAYAVVGTTADGTTSTYTDGTCLPDTEYTYRVRAYHSPTGSYGDYSVPVNKKTPAANVASIDQPYIALGNVLRVISEEPATSFVASWRSKPLDFGEAEPSLPSRYKTVDRVRLDYVDKYADTPVTVGLSTDDGETWVEETQSIGDGDGLSKSADFWFSGVTGRTIAVKVTHEDSDTSFEFTGLTLYFSIRGEAVE